MTNYKLTNKQTGLVELIDTYQDCQTERLRLVKQEGGVTSNLDEYYTITTAKALVDFWYVIIDNSDNSNTPYVTDGRNSGVWDGCKQYSTIEEAEKAAKLMGDWAGVEQIIL